MKDRLIFISCVKTKRNSRCRAKDLYISPYFKKAYAAAKKLNGKIWILSAKYGALKPDEIIDPYEKTLSHMTIEERKKWAVNILAQLKQNGVSFQEEAVFLCGKKYREYIMPRFPNNKCPVEGISFGKQLQLFERIAHE